MVEVIAVATGCDLFEPKSVVSYTSEDLIYSDDNGSVSQEHADGSLS